MFFDHQHQALAHRQQQLLARSGLLRQRLGRDAQVLQAPLAVADNVRRGWHWLLAHPQWVGLGMVVLVVWRPRRLWWLTGRAWAGWRLWQRLQRWRTALGPLLPPPAP